MNDEAPRMDPELAAALAAADAAGAGIDDGNPGAAVPGVAGIDYLSEATELVEFAVACFCPIFPSLDQLWDAKRQARQAAVLAPVMRKYGWSMGTLPELLAVAVTGQNLLISYKLAKLDYARMKAAQADKAEPPEPSAQ